ncbi:DUF3857 domain-containing protein [Mesoterricola sediminis]|uniref:DUF3857 domain-containing protein n=1 Tax=Mesoterricola sediminis TaxID=2927980 RepID=A0AA48GTX7_9BACT|nr:DUF3857 domain-containing protein [Mesoterricola sediminis]BDU77694.1 hypothetical protein METESE_26520 [Mesoterricola sediminis]
MVRIPSLVLILSAGAGALMAGGPWETAAPLAADPRAVVEAAKAHPPREGKAVLVLHEAYTWVLDAQGRRHRVSHSLYRIDGEAALKSWSEVGAGWGPWYQARPVIRARVITPDGKVHPLDPATLGEYATGQGGDGLFESRKSLNGPLPHTAVGVIVEQEIVADDTEPFFGTGSMARVQLAQNVPVVNVRFTLDVPAGTPLHWRVTNLAGKAPVQTTEGGRTRLTLETGPLEPPRDWEPLEDSGKEAPAAFWYSTLPGWGQVAEAYHALVKLDPLPEDLAARMAGLKASGLPRREVAAQALAELQKRVRYTGVEFDDAAIVPREPRETLQRGFGDCKDKATLLVALLEKAGVPARVALLNVGPDPDVEPDMPGMGMFDHAIVHCPGPDPLWIDPTVELAPAGQLPWQDQGRLALVVDPATRELVRIPKEGMEANRIVETRDVHLSEWGDARVVETTDYFGLDALSARSDLASLDAKAMRENMERYVKSAYNAKSLGALDCSDLKDVSKPVRFVLEAKDTPRGHTWWREAKAELVVWPMLSGLIRVLEGEDDAKPLPARTKDLRWRVPYVKEWTYRVHPPQGYALRKLPEGGEVVLGPARFRRTYGLEKDGSVTATHRFESGPEAWTAAEVEAARKAVKAFGETPRVDLLFDQEGELLLKAGKTGEALASFRKLAAAQPRSPLTLCRQAQALLSAGLGEAAREKARQAVALDPGSWVAQETLGWVLQFDLVGRRFKDGWDRAGSIAAYRKAEALDATEWGWRADFAYLLEHDAGGERYTAGASLDQAIAQYRFIRDTLKVDSRDEWLLGALGEAGRHWEALTLARDLKASAFRNGWLVASMVQLQDVDKSLAELPGLLGGQFTWKDAIAPAVLHLANAGAYARAARLIQGGPQGAEGADERRFLAEALSKVVPAEAASRAKADPKAALVRAIQAIAAPGAELKVLDAVATPGFKAHLAAGNRWEGFRNYTASVDLAFRSQGLRRRAALDLTLTIAQLAVDGDEARGYRVRATFPGTSGGTYRQTWYFTVDRGVAKVCACEFALATVGAEALRRADAGDLAGARFFLDGAREAVNRNGGDDPLNAAPFPYLWTRGQAATADEVRWAAAALRIWVKEDPSIGPLLEAGLRGAKDLTRRTYARLALAFRQEDSRQWEALEATTEPLRADFPDSPAAQGFHLTVLSAKKDWKGLLARSQELLAANPGNLVFQANRDGALNHLESREARIARLEAMVEREQPSTWHLNSLAWLHAVEGRVTEKTVELARRMIRMDTGDSASRLHTLATVLADRGYAAEAMQILHRCIQARGAGRPDSNEWFVVGLIAEALGEPEAARRCYALVKPSAPDSGELPGESCHEMAQQRLARLPK